MKKNKNLLPIITGVCFLIVILGGMAAGIAMPDKTFSSSENRMLQTLPDFSFTQYLDGRFESKVESYVDDQFPYRNQFIRVKTAADVTMGKLENNGVYRAKDGYLIEDLVAPDAEQLGTLEDNLAAFRKAHSGLQMYFLLAPNAGNILSDLLPFSVRLSDQNAYMDDFFDRMTDAGITPIDVRDRFREARDDIQIFYRTDHHWTTDGAYAAYQVAMPVMGFDEDEIEKYTTYIVKNDFRGTLYSESGFTNGVDDAIRVSLPDDRENYRQSVIYYADTQEKTTEFYQLGNLDGADAYTVFGGSNHPMYTIETPVSGKRRLLILKDSYANCFVPMLTQYFREIVVVDPRYYFEDLDDLIESENITDVLFLYNANTFFADDALNMMLSDAA